MKFKAFAFCLTVGVSLFTLSSCRQDNNHLSQFEDADFVTESKEHRCESDAHNDYLMAKSPVFRQNRDKIESFTTRFTENYGKQLKTRAVVTIPVVFHIIYNTAAENVTDAQVAAQIDVLNQDYRKMNADINQVPTVFQGLEADMEVQFVLAKRTPAGAATTGIERRQTTIVGFDDITESMKSYAAGGLDAWDAQKYLNIWTCNLTGGILGYAQFPGGPDATDGIVIRSNAVAGGSSINYGYGRTATHEVGHWLNLYHTFRGGCDRKGTTGSDFVDDTPNVRTATYGCPKRIGNSCSNDDAPDMTMNYMDYVYDVCMFMFTQGQKVRAKSVFAPGGARVGILTSNGGVAP
jgi:Pregnancy-associated plasma protein-A